MSQVKYPNPKLCCYHKLIIVTRHELYQDIKDEIGHIIKHYLLENIDSIVNNNQLPIQQTSQTKIIISRINPPLNDLTSHLRSSGSSVDSTIFGIDLALIDNTAAVAGTSFKSGLHAMPAPIVLLETTFLLNILPQHHQGAATETTTSHDAVESTIIEFGVVGCVAKGKARAAAVINNDRNGEEISCLRRRRRCSQLLSRKILTLKSSSHRIQCHLWYSCIRSIHLRVQKFLRS